jgi:hypothetical protein
MRTFDIYYDNRRIGSVLAETKYHAVDKVAVEHPIYERRLLKAVERRYYEKGKKG